MVGAALRIVVDVAVYRLARLEMANLVATVALLVALRTPTDALLARSGFALVLNLFSYLNNDYLDVDRDLRAGRASDKTRFLAEHRSAALAAQLGFLAALVGFALLYDPGLLVGVTFGAGLCALYSRWLKRLPFVDVLAMAAWGVGMTSVAFPLGSRLGWLLAGELGLFSAVFETIQVVRDHDADRAAGITTTAVFLGPRRAETLARLLVVASGAYGALFLHQIFGAIPLAAALVPPRRMPPARYWTVVRLVFATSLLGILAAVWSAGGTRGMTGLFRTP
ncbi:MAG TPA: UbiA family prenyltransferase [Polyangiaceae bacterium]|nr:UbiA family prenyltransferase [Polyangiaceae bacterium]